MVTEFGKLALNPARLPNRNRPFRFPGQRLWLPVIRQAPRARAGFGFRVGMWVGGCLGGLGGKRGGGRKGGRISDVTAVTFRHVTSRDLP